MPQYTYHCPACKHESSRIVKLAERDEQFCAIRIIDKARFDAVSLTASGPELSGAIEASHTCGMKLVRADLETTANMRQQWRASGSGC